MNGEFLDMIENDERRKAVEALLDKLSVAAEATAAEAVDLFEECCHVFLGEDDITMESGVYGFTGTEEFSVNFMRHFKSDSSLVDFDLQIVLMFACSPDGENVDIRESIDRAEPELWEEEKVVDDFFEAVRSSRTYAYLTGEREFRVEVLLESI